jgi:hypothetical protein
MNAEPSNRVPLNLAPDVGQEWQFCEARSKRGHPLRFGNANSEGSLFVFSTGKKILTLSRAEDGWTKRIRQFY